MKLAVAIQFTLPGFPCIYYGDEAGMQGYRDPFNRCGYPWGKENQELVQWHKDLGNLRKSCSALWDGDIVPVLNQGRYYYCRTSGVRKRQTAFRYNP